MSTPDAPTTPLTDDEVRWLLVRTAASLARLWSRIYRLGIGEPVKVSQDIGTPEPWLDVLPRNVSMSGVIHAVLLAQGLLLDEAVALRSPDRRRICLIVQHIQLGATDWSQRTLDLAEKLGVTLAATVIQETNGRSMHSEIQQLDGTYARHSGAMSQPISKG